MQDWDKVAAIVGIAAFIIKVLPLLSAPVWQALTRQLRQLFNRRYQVRVIAWDDLTEGELNAMARLQTLASAASDLALITSNSRARARSQISDLANFFERVWKVKSTTVARPDYLDLHKSYLGIDADALIAAVLIDATHGLGDGSLPLGDTFSIRYGDVKGRFRLFDAEGELDDYILGRLTGFPHHDFVRPSMRDLTRDDLKAVVDGYPPFYRRKFKANSDATVSHPIKTERDIVRGAWLVAIGFSTHEPLIFYNSGAMPSYREACNRVLHTLMRLRVEYEGHPFFEPMLDVAVSGVTRMNINSSGSGLPSITDRNTALRGCENNSRHGILLGARDLKLAMELFCDFNEGPLHPSFRHREGGEAILEEAVKAAVCGVYMWWQYVNNSGREMPGWMRNRSVRACRIWVEEGDSQKQRT